MTLIILAALTPFIFIPGLQGPSGLPKTFYLSFLALGAILLLRKKELVVFPWSLVVFIGAILLSAFWSINPHLFLSQLSLDLSGIALFLYVANCLKSKDLPVAIMILCVMGTVIALSVFLGVQIDPRVSGPGWSVVNEKFFTLLIAGLVPLAIGFAYLNISMYMPSFLRVTWQADWSVLLQSVCVILLVTYLIIYPSLATYFALGIIAVSVFGFVAWQCLKGSLFVRLVTIATIISIVLPVVAYMPELQSRLELSRIAERISWWKETGTTLAESNFLGVGRGQWQTRPHKRSPIHGTARHGWRPEHAHSDIMEIVGELGPIGLGSLGAFFFMTLLLRTGQMGLWLKLSLGVFLLEGLFWSLLHYAIFVPFIWMIAGMIWVDRVGEKREFSGAGY